MAQLRGVVALDGPVRHRKVHRRSQRSPPELGAGYLDTGAMYRAITLAVLRAGVDPADGGRVQHVAVSADLQVGTDPQPGPTVHLGGEDVAAEIRGQQVTLAVSRSVGRARGARTARGPAAADHRATALADAGGIVVEGRDIGTAVAPPRRSRCS